MPVPTARFTWDTATLRYRDGRTGRYVPHRHVFGEFEKVVRLSQRRMGALAGRWQARLITDGAFRAGMRQEIKLLHTAAALVANGGTRQMTAAAWGEVGGQMAREYAYLDRFVTKVQTGLLPRSSGLVTARARSYVAQARIFFWRTVNRRYAEAGMVVEACRHLGPAHTENCAGCDAVKDRWYPLELLPEIGSMECAWFCQCWVEYRVVRRAPPRAAEAAPAALLLPEPRSGHLSAAELRVFRRIAAAENPVGLRHLNLKEVRLAHRLVARGELRRARRGAVVYFSSLDSL